MPSGWANERPRERLLRFTYTLISGVFSGFGGGTYGEVVCTLTLAFPLILVLGKRRPPCSCIITANGMFDFDDFRAGQLASPIP